jgi:hypothetical protein
MHSTDPIHRYQRILIAVLGGSILLMAALLFVMNRHHLEQLAGYHLDEPLPAPAASDAAPFTLYIPVDSSNSLTPTNVLLSLPAEPTARARALLTHLFAVCAQPDSTHPIPAGPSVNNVFLLPAPAGTSSPDPTSTPLLAVVNLNAAFAQSHPSGAQPENLTLQAILATLHANLPQIAQVRFLVDGQPAQALAGHADISRVYNVTEASQASGMAIP